MKPLFVALLTLAHCGPIWLPGGAILQPTNCVTPCGLRIIGPLPNTWSCEDAIAAETAAMPIFRKYTADSRLYDCAALRGYSVAVYQLPDAGFVPDFTDEWGRDVTGLCDCVSKQIVLGSRSPKAGSLTHEMAHAMQGCVTRGIDTSDPQHANWQADGIYDAIAKEKL